MTLFPCSEGVTVTEGVCTSGTSSLSESLRSLVCAVQTLHFRFSETDQRPTARPPTSPSSSSSSVYSLSSSAPSWSLPPVLVVVCHRSTRFVLPCRVRMFQLNWNYFCQSFHKRLIGRQGLNGGGWQNYSAKIETNRNNFYKFLYTYISSFSTWRFHPYFPLHYYFQFCYFISNPNISNLLFIHHHRLSRGRLNIVCPLPPLMRELGFGLDMQLWRERDQRYEEEMDTTSHGTSSVPFASNPFVKAEAGSFCTVDRCGYITLLLVEKSNRTVPSPINYRAARL